MHKTEIRAIVEVKDKEEQEQLQHAFDTMVNTLGAKGIIKLVKIYSSDVFVKNLVKMKLNIR